MEWEMLPPKYDGKIDLWEDDPQDRAPMTEAIDELTRLRTENDRLREALLHIVGKYDSPTPIGTSEWYELAKAALRREGE